MRATLIAVLVTVAIALLSPGESEAGSWRYSNYHQSGYSYYHSCYYQGSYYPAGYYQYYEPPVVIATYYQREYVPVVFTTYQPGSVSTYQTQPLATFQQQQAIQPPAAFSGVQQVNTATTTVQRAGVQQVQAAQTQTTTQDQQLVALLTRMDARLAALEAKSGTTGTQAAPPPPLEPAAAQKKSVLLTRCAICHTTETANKVLPSGAKLGGGKVFFEGEGDAAKLNVTEKQLTQFYRTLTRGEMPKPYHGSPIPAVRDGKLDNNEAQALLEELSQASAKASE